MGRRGPSTVVYENPDPSHAVYVELDDSGEIVEWDHGSRDESSSVATPFAVRPPTTLPRSGILDAICNVAPSSFVLRNYYGKSDGPIALRCGNVDVGYNHIRSKHAGHWTGQMGGPGNWRDFMSWATDQALTYPLRVSVQPGQKRCHATPVIVVKASGQTKTLHATVIASINNKIVITSYPPNNMRC